jgi:hypothetical protein
MLRMTKSMLTTVLTTTLLCLAAAPAQAQTGLVSVGAGTYQAFTAPVIVNFMFLVRETGNGGTQGLAVFRGPTGVVFWNVTSHMHIGNAVLFAGEVVLILGTDPNVHVGQTAFTAVIDNGHGSADEIASLSLVPPQFGNPTIQQIVGLIGPPTPSSFTPVLSGNILVR